MGQLPKSARHPFIVCVPQGRLVKREENAK